MDFSSDTSAPAHPAVIDGLAAANQNMMPSYGGDPLHTKLRQELARLFETDDFDVWLCASGTAANALALSVMCSATGAILCHEEAHIERDERGAPEFFTGGAKLRLLPGAGAQLAESALDHALAANAPDFVHGTPLETLSLTNLTECGTAYSAAQIQNFSAKAHSAGLNVHLDGARLANALVASPNSLAEMTWKAGVDVVTLGLTKTGAIGCELIILFGAMRQQFGNLRARAKRSGHMPPKMRYLAAQALALFREDLWLDLARAANRQAKNLSEQLCAHPEVRLAFPTDGNEVFVFLPEDLRTRFQQSNVKFYSWPGGSWRFVCNWTTTDEDIALLTRLISREPG